ncbi:hypothetical protein [Candidatus Synchoanobacter obligatus]|uniref:Uncharacterized protein n=1 Tax=Candidatus Synchoanobacter obligatus TaxID=2919597 RepID=A0ABT1L5H9_9GAMM|nr:hypothetical protein [Candidatus Synchoanobacter obligatus]MCP8352171.1 hypothetical protein [Candidatus Synchoanobacter obligatus]
MISNFFKKTSARLVFLTLSIALLAAEDHAIHHTFVNLSSSIIKISSDNGDFDSTLRPGSYLGGIKRASEKNKKRTFSVSNLSKAEVYTFTDTAETFGLGQVRLNIHEHGQPKSLAVEHKVSYPNDNQTHHVVILTDPKNGY